MAWERLKLTGAWAYACTPCICFIYLSVCQSIYLPMAHICTVLISIIYTVTVCFFSFCGLICNSSQNHGILHDPVSNWIRLVLTVGFFNLDLVHESSSFHHPSNRCGLKALWSEVAHEKAPTLFESSWLQGRKLDKAHNTTLRQTTAT